MSKLGKAILIGVITLVIGIIVMVAALGLSGWSFDGDFELYSYVCDKRVDDLSVYVGVGNVDIKFYDGEYVKVDYEHNKRMTTNITLGENSDTNVNTLEIRNEMRFSFFNFGRWFKKAPKMTVYIPNDTQVNLKCNVNAGIANVDSGKFGNVSFVLNAGTLNFENIESARFFVRLNAGTVKLQNLVATKTHFEVNAGDFKVAKIVCDELNLKLNAGKFTANDVTCSSNLIEVNAGDCKIEKISLDNINLFVNAGNFDMTVQGAKSDFNIGVEKRAGSCNISNQTGTSPNKIIKVDVSAGSVNVQFES